jgi:hypothetical protein
MAARFRALLETLSPGNLGPFAKCQNKKKDNIFS